MPISVGNRYTVRGNQPCQGMTPESTIFNFYPSDGNGNYIDGNFTLERSTGGYLAGFVIAPTGKYDILESFLKLKLYNS